MDTSTELYEKLARLQWLLQKQHLRNHAMVGPMADTTRGQGRILAILKMKDGISTKDMSYLLGVRVSSLNEVLAKLEKAEYITREPSQEDKRVILVKLTQKGREEEMPEKEASVIFTCLSSDEQKLFGEYLDRVIATIEAEFGADDDRDGWAEWMHAARERMGDDQLERLLTLRGDFRGMPGGRGGFGHFGHGPFGFGSDGSAPEDHNGFPFGGRGRGRE